MKILYSYLSKPNKNHKFHDFQVSWDPSFRIAFELLISLQRFYGDLRLLNFTILDLISFSFNHSTKEDHAGLRIGLHILGVDILYSYIDTRHYDYEKDEFITHVVDVEALD